MPGETRLHGASFNFLPDVQRFATVQTLNRQLCHPRFPSFPHVVPFHVVLATRLQQAYFGI
jgi:hypothetical protein